MDNNLYNRYAFALLDIAKEENLVDEYRSEILVLLDVLTENKEFIKLLNSVSLSKDERYEIVDRVFNKFKPAIINYIKVIIKKNRTYYLRDIVKETLYRFDEALNIERGKIISAHDITEKEYNDITKAIEKNLKHRVELKSYVDESLIGGFKIILTNDAYDTSVLSKVENLKKMLLNNGGDK